MTLTVITGGRLVDATRPAPSLDVLQGAADAMTADPAHTLDVVVDDATAAVVAVGAGLAAAHPDARLLDAGGCLVVPALVDLGAHLGQPGFEQAETIETASRAAALGGYGAVVALPDTDPCTDSAAVVAELRALAKAALCEIVPAGALTHGRDGVVLGPMGELADLGVRLFTDAPRCVQDGGVVRRALEYAAGVAEATGAPLVVAQRCRADDLAGRSVMHEGPWSARLGLPGQPALAEELIVTREIALARLTGGRVHLQQLSTAGSVALVRAAKAEGLRVTADVAPAHLVLTDADCAGFDPNLKLDPPLRTAADVAALRAGLADGTIDAVATGHRPCPRDAKELPFDQAPPGSIGLETALAVLLTLSCDGSATDGAGELPLGAILAALSWQPAAVAGLRDRHGGPIEPGRAANLAVVDPAARWRFEAASSASRATNSCFDGRRLTGRVRHTVVAGEPVVIDGEAQR
ncbi:MAG: dihydroorotase [Acidimicrobiales bacterium]